MLFESSGTNGSISELTTLQKRIERLKFSNDDTVEQLSDTTSRWKRLAQSLGFDDVHETQVAIDTADYEVPYKECFERMRKLEEKAKLDGDSLVRLRGVEEENRILKTRLEMLEEENKFLKAKLVKAGRYLFFYDQPFFLTFLNKNKRLFPLDTDATSHLLSTSTTFAALLPLISTSKFVYGVFQSRRESIVHAIALNQLGDILPQALRLARYEDAHLLQRNVEDLPKEEDIYAQAITPSEARILAHNAQTVQELEDCYSFRRRDRTSRTSVLTHIESKRFQRALYRIILLSFAYGLDSISYQDKSLRQFFSDPDELDRNYVKQKRFLNRFVSEEDGILGGGADGSFSGCLDVYDWDLECTYFAVGPAVILDCYKNGTAHMHTGPVLKRFKEDNGPYSKFITLTVEILLKERDVTKPGPFATVLDGTNGGEDRCKKMTAKGTVGINSLLQVAIVK
ncbi:hypothetical protein BDZ94DRAFT_1310514 [Collybia nuda]|uniref:Uncharacterized protein n=1 Tax=Collybia nuda TaxID=64659 RepID=A0A9P6CD93_9AGAR|nr:hypothetical protein BDZ94DRAFT_1310514 [Collybia nuda]